jgi:two-component system sensor histidine kinase BaeS
VRRLEHDDRSTLTGVRRADELGQAARALDELTQRLDALERERQGLEEERRLMITSIGHDLRTPLAAIRVAVEALVDGVASDPPRYLRSMSQNVDVLAALIEDLFLLSRIDAGRFELDRSPVELVEIVTEVVEMLRPTALSRGISLDTHAPGEVMVEANPSAIGRVVRNLVDNALRHTPTGSCVDVMVTVDSRCARVEVVDQGEGFPPGFAAQAFDRFSRADPSRERSTGGAGLGLAIARGLVEAQLGTIEIGPAPGGRVSFTVPLVAA